MWYPCMPRVLFDGRTEHTEVPGTGVEVVQKLTEVKGSLALGRHEKDARSFFWFCVVRLLDCN